jgi:hypothetical protein
MIRPYAKYVKRKRIYKIYKWKPPVSRPIGIQNNTREGDVRMDLQTVKLKNWKKSALKRELWKTFFLANAPTCPLWTSWSPLPTVAEV